LHGCDRSPTFGLRGHLKEFSQKPRRFPTLGTSVHVCESDDAAMSLRFRNSQVWQPACSLFSSRLTRDSWRWGGCPGVVPRNWTRTMTPRLLGFIAITGLSLLLVVRLAAADSTIDFSINAPNQSGAVVSYDGTSSGPLIGTGILISNVAGIGTPSND